MIRNGLFWYEGIDKPDYSIKAMKEFHTPRTRFLKDRSDVSKEVKEGLHPLIIKTQTRRPNRGIYKEGRSYAVQRKRGVKAEPGIRIVMDEIWLENGGIGREDALAEGGYTPAEFEAVFFKIYPRCGSGRWVFKFHPVKIEEGERDEELSEFVSKLHSGCSYSEIME
jgi:hypothetical protein